MFNKKYETEDDFDYEMEELDEEFGDNFSNVVSRKLKNNQPKKNKEIKFRKDGYFEDKTK